MRLQKAFAVAAVLVVGQVRAQSPPVRHQMLLLRIRRLPAAPPRRRTSCCHVPRFRVASRAGGPSAGFLGGHRHQRTRNRSRSASRKTPRSPPRALPDRPPVPPVEVRLKSVADALPPAARRRRYHHAAPATRVRHHRLSGGASRGTQSVASNPVWLISRAPGRWGAHLGLTRNQGFGWVVWVGDASGVLSGGRSPGQWGLNSSGDR